MYGLWLYKDLATEYGKCRVEIYQKEYNGENIEIEAFAGDSLSISLDNLSEIISPIGKSVCSFGIINTNQFDYDILFTPDATKFMVVVKTMEIGKDWITRWSGFLTPDFFAEDLQYRSVISLSARDGIGYLNEIQFDYSEDKLLTVQTLIDTAFNKISFEYPMQVVFNSAKIIDGYTLDSAYIASDLFKDGSWGEAIETVIHDCGLQMRWVDNNTIAIYDLSAMPEQFENKSVQFINSSGYREILPAWKTLSQKQDYKTRGNLYDGVANAELMVLDHSELAYYPFGGAPQQFYVNYYKLLSKWTTAWNAYTGKNMNDPLSGVYISSAIDSNKREQNYIFYKRDIQYSNYPVKIKLKTSKTVHFCDAPTFYPETLAPYDLYNPADPDNTGYVQLSLFVSVILHADNGQDYYLGREWYQYNNTSQGMSVMKFTLNQATYGNISAEDIEIEAQSIPYNGELSIRIHGYQMEDFKYVRVNDNYPYPDWNAFFAKIEDVTIEIDNDNLPSGVNMGVTINEAHNIKRDEDYTINTLPNGIGGETAVVNGLFNSNGNSLYFAKLNNQTEEYTLLELVGREAIHYNLKNYEKLSGDIKAVDGKPLLFNSCYKYNNKTFIPYSYSLSLISNTMNITSMQEVEPYVTAELTEIHSKISTGGGSTVGGGNNIALQYSSNAGNAKRIYELDNASEDDVKGAYIVVDKAGLAEAKKFNLQDIAEMTDWFTLQTLESGEKVLITPYNLASQGEVMSGGIADIGSGGSGGGLIQRVYGYDNITDVFDNSVKTDTFNAFTIAKIAERVSALENGGVDLTGYATESWVLNQNYLTSVSFSEILDTPTTLAGYGITDALPISGGTIKGTADGYTQHIIKINTNDIYLSDIQIQMGDISKAGVGYSATNAISGHRKGVFLYNVTASSSIGVKDDGTPYYNDNTLIHSGNIGSQSVDRAKHLMGSYTSNFDANECYTTLNSIKYHYGFSPESANIPESYTWSNGLLEIGLNSSGDTAQFFFSFNKPLSYRSRVTESWKTIAFTDSNVASATKLQTARTIWGQSFDGTGNVGGIPLFNAYAEGGNISTAALMINKSGSLFGIGTASNHLNNISFGLVSGSGAWKSELMTITDSGNVLIGTTTDNGGKLQVSGSINAVKDGYAYYWGTNMQYSLGSNSNNDFYIFGDYGDFRIGTAGVERIRVKANGNVLIGTTEDNGNKLQIIGNINTSIGLICGTKNNYTAYFGAANPIIGNPNTGALIYSYGDNPIHFYTNNTARMQINGNGNVLIGTTTDSGYKLDVNGKSHFSAYTGDNSYVHIGPLAFGLKIESRGNGNTFLQSQRFDTETAYYNIVLQELGGNVLIGTTENNGNKLQVAGNISATSVIVDSIQLSNGQALSVYSDGTAYLSGNLVVEGEITSGGGGNAASVSEDIDMIMQLELRVAELERRLAQYE